MTDWAKDDLMDPPYPEDEKPSRRGGFRVIRHVIALSLVLVTIGGLATAGWIGFQSWRTRGSEGLAPLIQADAGPTRVRPEQPGGLVIPHQDRLVLNDLNGGGVSTTAENILPPPEEPMPRPQVALAATEYASSATPVAAAVTASPETTQTSQTPVAAPVTADKPPIPRSTPVAAREAAAKVPAIAVPVIEQVAQANEPPPELITRPAAEATTTPSSGFASVENLRQSHRIQLAAVDSEEAARRTWLRFQGLYQDLLSDLSLLVQQVEVNNRTYFRVQGGPLEADNAGRICRTIKSRGADCLVVRPQ